MSLEPIPSGLKRYELLSMIDGSACLLLENVQTGRRFYSQAGLYTCTRCIDQVSERSSKWLVAIGGISYDGLLVVYEDFEPYTGIGLGLAQKL